MTTAHSPSADTVPAAEDADATVRTDLVLGGRATMTAEYLRGLIVAGQLVAAGTPRKLPNDLFPDADPVLVQEIWDRAFAVGWQTRGLAGRPYFHRDQLARLQGELAEAGHVAMAGMVGRALATALHTHPADDASDGREH
ncbi:hypothetical protein [Streptomyces sp. Da 82-17]|uniref:hypothetical protein n=1 Tax=Streptomyces sp. Da 82-17 TaxID=3377116 RepID=UPI0038D42E54